MRNLIVICVVLALVIPSQARTITVDDDGPADFNNIQVAIDDANDGDQVVVADGLYKGEGNRDIDYDGKAITVKSQNGPVRCIIDSQGSEAKPHRGFYFHSAEGSDSVLDGFTITGGYARGDLAGTGGGGIYCEGSAPLITNCLIIGNTAGKLTGYGYGGGIYCKSGGPTITNCRISRNSAGDGGGVCCYRSWATVKNCTITGNTARVENGHGGGIYCLENSDVNISNCVISENSALEGGGVCCQYNSDPTITKCTITNNRAGIAGGLYCNKGKPVIANCILWSNTSRGGPQQICLWQYSTVWVDYSDIQGGRDDVRVGYRCSLNWGSGNINADPCFAFVDDYHLMPGSPCINAGDPNYVAEPNETDLEKKPRIIGNRMDMGAYEYDPESPSIAISPSTVSFSCAQSGRNPDPQSMFIRNCGPGTLDWEITKDCEPVHVQPRDGISTGDIHEITLTVEANALVPDTYGCVLRIVDEDAANSGVAVPVTLHVGRLLQVPDTFATIQSAIDAADDYDTVLVADGIYSGDGNRDLDLRGKAITVRSESGPERCIIDCNGTETNHHRAFEIRSGEGEDSRVEGFTVSKGYNWFGGAILCLRSRPTIANCIIRNNFAKRSGGGIFCMGDAGAYAGPRIVNCAINGNRCDEYGGGLSCDRNRARIINCSITGNSSEYSGGGVECSGGDAKISNCTIADNTAARRGGGIYCSYWSPTISYCKISANSAKLGGGGIYCGDSSPKVTGCTITGNRCDEAGGGINSSRCILTISNCTFAGNSAVNGNALACDSWDQLYPSSVEVSNCILWNDTTEVWNNDSSEISIRFSDIQGGWDGEGDVDVDPCFVEAGYWDVNGAPGDVNDDFWVDGDYHLLPGSPCIDTGDPNYIPQFNETDLDGHPRIVNDRIDMGAYEYTPRILAEISIKPQILNLQGKGKWIMCVIRLPEDYNVTEIEPNSVLLEDEIEAERVWLGDEFAVAKFSRRAVKEILGEVETPAEVELVVSGELSDGTIFEGTDTIRVIDKGKRRNNLPGRAGRRVIRKHRKTKGL